MPQCIPPSLPLWPPCSGLSAAPSCTAARHASNGAGPPKRAGRCAHRADSPHSSASYGLVQPLQMRIARSCTPMHNPPKLVCATVFTCGARCCWSLVAGDWVCNWARSFYTDGGYSRRAYGLIPLVPVHSCAPAPFLQALSARERESHHYLEGFKLALHEGANIKLPDGLSATQVWSRAVALLAGMLGYPVCSGLAGALV